MQTLVAVVWCLLYWNDALGFGESCIHALITHTIYCHFHEANIFS